MAHKAGFLYRPIVDEYVELLWTMMSRLWPGMQRKRRQGKIVVSCDVDQPFDRVGTSSVALARSVGADLLRRKAPAVAVRRLRNFIAHRQGDLRFDPYYTFDWYMDVCERHGRQAAFYFIADHPAGAIDGTYSMREPRIPALIRKLSDRGHEVGMHGSYNTFRDSAQMAKERSLVREACRAAGVDDSVRGNRQHYLRWSAAETPDHLDDVGFEFDTSGSYADRPGFRYGTSHPFAMWSWRSQVPLRIIQRPLVVMECSIIAKNYLGLGYTEDVSTVIDSLKRNAMRHGGDFVMLWHNSHFLNPADRVFFEKAIR
jgi:peptidoglycan/xylan/chitin deacetylase (PgdA/CDA1 family)